MGSHRQPVSGTGGLRAVLLDMDGTLCDTEPIWIATEYAMAARHQAPWTREDGLAQVGNNLLDTGRYMQRRMGLEMSAEAIVEELVDGVVAALDDEPIRWRPGALDLITACNRTGVPIALVTMSYARFADAVVTRMPRGRFDATVTGDMVDHGKPAPDAYLKAAELLGVAPTECVAVEDSPGGARSAQRAGCLVVVVPHQVPVPVDVGHVRMPTLADMSLSRLRELVANR